MDNLLAAPEYVVGFIVVLIAFGALYFALTRGGQNAQSVPAKPTAPTFATRTTEADGEILAIGAAVALLLGEKARIIALKPTSGDWSREGRRQHHTSHRVR